ncbi:hypothetical protein CC79DRAFT_1324085 [Sarocladium strictum]
MTPDKPPRTTTDISSADIASIFQNHHNEYLPRIQASQSSTSAFRPSTSGTLPPDYSDALANITPTSSSSRISDDELPKYDYTDKESGNTGSSSRGAALSTAPGFNPTKRFQIETTGHPLIALPLPPKPTPIPVYDVSGTGQIEGLAYTSLRDARSSSNSCVLIHAEDNLPVCTTTYRFGPSRPPKLLIFPPTLPQQPVFSSNEVATLLKSEPPAGIEPIEVHSDGCTTRSQTLRTPLGTFHWRYGTRTERREASACASSLLVLEKLTTVSIPTGKNKKHREEIRRRRVAQLVRSDEVRTEGSTKRTAGNGGRLEIDLREWRDGKGEMEEVERLVVASCLVMLKKEVDRRRLHQTVVLMAGASGGP